MCRIYIYICIFKKKIYIYIPGSSRYVKFLPFGCFLAEKAQILHTWKIQVYIYVFIYIYIHGRKKWLGNFEFVWGGIFSKLEGWFIRFLEWICLERGHLSFCFFL